MDLICILGFKAYFKYKAVEFVKGLEGERKIQNCFLGYESRKPEWWYIMKGER